MEGDDELLRDIHSQVHVHTAILEDVRAEQVKTNGRLTAVEREALILRGGLIVISFLMSIGIGVAGVVAAVVIRGGV